MDKLRAAVVGLRMGWGHVDSYVNLPEFELAAVCDLDAGLAADVSAKSGGVPTYTDYKRMLEEVRPDVVAVATPNNLHCEMTVLAAEMGAKGIYCEKPMAVCMREARKMRDACAAKGAKLVIGHQRRVSKPYMTMKKAIDDGMVGDVYLVRGLCSGDFLSDGTHTVDSLMYLNDDSDVEWVLGQVYRGPLATEEERAKSPYAYIGRRYGHNTERGAISSFQLANGVRCETVTGDQMKMPERWYQDIEVFGSAGRLWRNNDQSDPPVKVNVNGKWEALPLIEGERDDHGLYRAHMLHAESIHSGADHPMSVDRALKGFEVTMSIYESARLNARIVPPLRQDEFPLDLMMAEKGQDW
ncbi:MAG: Gfo/Idh/MocA family oxidoreductase [Oscillospiraceae bacterium]|nr:Gfo/Idh/MocA family oxidoreductase [Oscillospiraceae bacterium]